MIFAIAGPTGSGKSDLAMALAERIPKRFGGRAEIVSVDSMQVYRGMTIGTAKPSAADRVRVPHHGLDLVEPEEPFHVGAYAQRVRPVLKSLLDQRKIPILVGGSGLYFRGLLEGLCEAPPQDPLVREALIAEGAARGGAALFEELTAVDPAAAGKIHPNNLHRVVRALEVYRVSQRPISDWQAQTPPAPDWGDVRFFGLDWEREELYRRIERRIDGWLVGGWPEEARGLYSRRLSQTARACLGYRELFNWIAGRVDWAETIERIKRNSRRYAKRQLSWFRADARVRWIGPAGRGMEALVEEMLAAA